MSRSRDIANLLGSSSPIVDKTIIDAKGDLLIGSADNTVTKLAAGSTGQLPLVDSSTSSGLRYVDPPTNRNLIINGAMQVAQRGTSKTGVTGDGYHTADRWMLFAGSGGTWTQTVETDGPNGSGLTKSLKMLCTTATTPITSNGYIIVGQRLEGQDVQRIKKGTSAAEQVTLSFWVKSNVTGSYVIEVSDSSNSRSISAAYSISTSGTWERKVITFASDGTGTLSNDNARALEVFWWLAAGTTFTSGTLATTWASLTSANRAVGQTNLAAATNNYWQITGVQLETGPVATPFEFEPYETTLRKCQRYYESSFYGLAVPTSNSGTYVVGKVSNNTVPSGEVYGDTNFQTEKRATPTVTVYPFTTSTNTGRVSDPGGTDLAANSGNVFAVNRRGFYVLNDTGGTVSTQRNVVIFNYAASAEL